MFKRILVPVDLTDKSARAIAVALELAQYDNGAITLLHVIETLDVPFEQLSDFYGELETKARGVLDTLSEPLRKNGVTFEERICYGKRAPEIVSFADENEYDLIVLTSHRLDPEHPEGSFMTISHQVAIATDVTALLLK